jgi:serine/threonine-protein kinase
MSPPVPFAYLLRLGSAIEKEQLTPAEQADLVSQLRDCLDTEDDEGVKDDARELLRALRRRPDVTFKHAGEIDSLLAGAPSPRSGEQATTSGVGQSVSSGAAASTAGARQTATHGEAAAARGSPAPSGYASPAPGYSPPPPRYGPPPPGYLPPAGTGFYSAPGPPPAQKSRMPLYLLIGAVVIAVLVVGGVVLFGPDGQGGGPDPTTTTQAAPSTTEPAPTTSSEPPPPSAEEQLLAILPGDINRASCSTAAPAGDGDIAALGCGPARTQPGPLTAQFNLYPPGAVGDVFRGDVAEVAVPALNQAQGQSCPDFLGYGSYSNGSEVRGQVACWVGQDNASYLMWTDDEFAAEAVVTIPNGGGAGIYTLWNWWVDPARAAFGP